VYLAFHDLILVRRAAEARGQHLLDEPRERAVRERHPLGGQLLVAVDAVQVRLESELAENAATGTPRDGRRVAALPVEEQLAGPRNQGRQEQRIDLAAILEVLRADKQRELVLHEMSVIRRLGARTRRCDQ